MDDRERIDRIKDFFRKSGYILDDSLLESFYAAITTKPRFLILSGSPGTGKTSFALLFARGWEIANSYIHREENKSHLDNEVSINGVKHRIFKYWYYQVKKDVIYNSFRTDKYIFSFERSGIIRCLDLNSNIGRSVKINKFPDWVIISHDEKYLATENCILSIENMSIIRVYPIISPNWIYLYHIFNDKVFNLLDRLNGLRRHDLVEDRYLVMSGENTIVMDLEKRDIIVEENEFYYDRIEVVLGRYIVMSGEDTIVLDLDKTSIITRDIGFRYANLKISKDGKYIAYSNSDTKKTKLINVKLDNNPIVYKIESTENIENFEIIYDRYVLVILKNHISIHDLESQKELFSFPSPFESGFIRISSDSVSQYDKPVVMYKNYPFVTVHYKYKNETIICNLATGGNYNISGYVKEWEGMFLVVDKGSSHYLWDLRDKADITSNLYFKTIKLLNDKYFIGWDGVITRREGTLKLITKEVKKIFKDIRLVVYYIEPSKEIKEKYSFVISFNENWGIFLNCSPDRMFAILKTPTYYYRENYRNKSEYRKDDNITNITLMDLQRGSFRSLKLSHTDKFTIYDDNEWQYAILDSNDTIVLFDIKSGWKEVWNYKCTSKNRSYTICNFKFSPDRRFFAISDDNLIIYDIQNDMNYRFRCHSIEFDKSSRFICGSIDDNNICLIDLHKGIYKAFKGYECEFVYEYFIYKDKNKVGFWNLLKWKLYRVFQGDYHISPNKRAFIILGNGNAIIFNPQKNKIEKINEDIYNYQFSNDGDVLALGMIKDDKSTVSLWDMNSVNEIWRSDIYYIFSRFGEIEYDTNKLGYEMELTGVKIHIVKSHFICENETNLIVDQSGEDIFYSLKKALLDAQRSNRILLLRVRPEWTNPRDVLGYRNFQGKFIEGPIYRFLKRAKWDSNNLYFLILDEMNLSHPEHYLSDIISAMETGGKINIDGEEIEYPENLVIIGTVNRDETTQNLSPRLLSRAITLEFRTKWELVRKEDNLKVSNQFLANIFYEINKELEKSNLGIGYREYVRAKEYITNAKKVGYDEVKALDEYINSKIIPRIRGIHEDFLKDGQNIIENLIKLSRKYGLYKSESALKNKMRLLESRGIVE